MAERIPRGLVVGQAPPLPPDARQPEKRLARLAGLSLDELWAFFDRVDLLGALANMSYHQWSAGYRKHRCDGHRFPLSVARLVAARLRRFGRLERYAVPKAKGQVHLGADKELVAEACLALQYAPDFKDDWEVSNSSIIPTKDEMIEHIETEKALDKVGIKILEASVCQSEWRKAQCFLTVGPKACERTREARVEIEEAGAGGVWAILGYLKGEEAPKCESRQLWASDVLQADKEVVLRAVQENGGALAYASQDRDVVLAAVQQRGISLRYAAQELKGDPEVVKAAARQSKRALMYAAEFLKKDAAFIREASSQALFSTELQSPEQHLSID
ncbi:Hypothetical protein SCF082_LOCUS27971 [Durusdinium trenchii]|uniref:DUF4116 domain-containing protein n=1 Tax=Durusdinium trenchii TaxID=1381693 RepID=A0ABP0MI16_9DINO